ncbi:hypothetical protein GYA13_05245 [Candidatus Kuenenbacteria bacterium]|nr:hypothetical protein [Candidatus Kuenenbacteria bacterium]
MLTKKSTSRNQRGEMLMMALVFTALFTVTAMGIASVIASQHRLGIKKINWQKSLAAAEAGVNYYRWHLAHAPEDYQDGTGHEGPYIHDYKDNLGNTIGHFSLDITSTDESCSNTAIIEATGWMNDDPNVKRKVRIKYGRPSLASFAFLTNANAWFGENETLHGPVHSNWGIRMDGYNDSLTTSSQPTYTCGSEHGCSKENCDSLGHGCSWISGQGCVCPGVWGDGGDQSLWVYPYDNVDFNAITTGIRNLADKAEMVACAPADDCYWPQRGLGYHIIFKNNGTFDVYRVKQLENPVWGYTGKDWVRDTDDIKSEEFEGNYALPTSCGIIFIEDDVWVEGIIKGSVTLASAKFPESSNKSKIIINGSLIYEQRNNTNALGLVSQTNIIIPLYGADDNIEIDAALLAQKGRVFRKHYCYGENCSHPVPANAKSYVSRNSITIYGSIISNDIWTWSWVDDGGEPISGYANTNAIYDPNLTYNPPPDFPATGDPKIVKWEEITEK